MYNTEGYYLTSLDSDFLVMHTGGDTLRRQDGPPTATCRTGGFGRTGREGKVTPMAMPGHGPPAPPEPDPYQLLGVTRQATPAEIALAWRRKARAEHPDARPRDAAAPARFRALAEAYRMLSDPARRAAYDEAAARAAQAGAHAPEQAASARAGGIPVPVIVVSRPGAAPARGAPLWAGPVRVEPPDAPPDRPPAPPVPDARHDERARLMLLAGLAARYLDDGWEWPW
ncbi:MAG: J domain-containing protein [Streptosporangiaceae bacterium]|nr:J domain-containing protein [Streptosporangiaceae bacterium]MBV9854196.1 J domain-containing protein [Streptosporangiaceae bacterium]